MIPDETKYEEVTVDPQWVVIARHFGTPGGVFDHGTADIKGFHKSFEDADVFARELFEKTQGSLVLPVVWVLKCERTYKADTDHTCVVISSR